MRNFDYQYLRIAKIWSENSYSRRNKVGAIIVKDGMIISDGYNGTPAGFDNNCENVDIDGLNDGLKTIYNRGFTEGYLFSSNDILNSAK